MRVSLPVAVLAALVCSCSTNGTIVMRDASEVVGKIERSDADRVYIKTNAGAVTEVARTDIAHIDHPGGGATVGGLMMAIPGLAVAVPGALFLGMGANKNCQDSVGPACVVGGAMLVTGGALMFGGVALTVWGASTTADSKDAAAPPPNWPNSFPPSPSTPPAGR